MMQCRRGTREGGGEWAFRSASVSANMSPGSTRHSADASAPPTTLERAERTHIIVAPQDVAQVPQDWKILQVK